MLNVEHWKAVPHIQVQLDALLPDTLDISPIDLYVIFGNTLDNALEACQLLPEDRRWLHIKLRYRGKTFFYQTENPKMAGAQTKKAGSRHGYGLKNIRRSVKKYSGQVVIEETDERYILTIRMNG